VIDPINMNTFISKTADDRQKKCMQYTIYNIVIHIVLKEQPNISDSKTDLTML